MNQTRCVSLHGEHMRPACWFWRPAETNFSRRSLRLSPVANLTKFVPAGRRNQHPRTGVLPGTPCAASSLSRIYAVEAGANAGGKGERGRPARSVRRLAGRIFAGRAHRFDARSTRSLPAAGRHWLRAGRPRSPFALPLTRSPIRSPRSFPSELHFISPSITPDLAMPQIDTAKREISGRGFTNREEQI